MPPAGMAHGGHEPPAGARDQRHPARPGDRLGHFDGAALHPAGDQRGQDLEDDGAVGHSAAITELLREMKAERWTRPGSAAGAPGKAQASARE